MTATLRFQATKASADGRKAEIMDTLRICKQCRQPLPDNAPEGLCPQCLAQNAPGSEPSAPDATININPLTEAVVGNCWPPRPGDFHGYIESSSKVQA
jgi:hypothetical protein